MSYDTPPPPPPGNPPPPGGYGMPQPGFGAQPQKSTLALVSLITGIVGIICCGSLLFSIAATVTGYLAKKEIAESGGMKTGEGQAKAGFILGIIGMVIGVIYLILLVSGQMNFNFSSSTS